MIRIQARIGQPYAFSFGISAAIVQLDGDRPMRILRLGDGTGTTWEELPESPVATEPTLILGDEEARALLDALLRHYQGASDMHTVRADLVHERDRVDKLINAVIDIAARSE